MGELVKSGLSGLNSRQDIQEVKNFRKRNARKFQFAKQALDQAQESLEERVVWMERNLEEVTTWLKGQFSPAQTT
ncbi:hypothetical protein J437_LFUL009853 [Ladona fulva]|uniref:Uncharacterized protein n=1 Tax=Ladona fulva TaxID=123851 RepID=A0A8K0K8Y9_LADFU|nr:hypothetical protein J437_LFUL009853 [Ladona fulva]